MPTEAKLPPLPAWLHIPARRLQPDEIQRWRAHLGLTQAGLAACLDVSLRAVEQWEAASPPPPPYLAFALERLANLKALDAADQARRSE